MGVSESCQSCIADERRHEQKLPTDLPFAEDYTCELDAQEERRTIQANQRAEEKQKYDEEERRAAEEMEKELLVLAKEAEEVEKRKKTLEKEENERRQMEEEKKRQEEEIEKSRIAEQERANMRKSWKAELDKQREEDEAERERLERMRLQMEAEEKAQRSLDEIEAATDEQIRSKRLSQGEENHFEAEKAELGDQPKCCFKPRHKAEDRGRCGRGTMAPISLGSGDKQISLEDYLKKQQEKQLKISGDADDDGGYNDVPKGFAV